MCVGFWSLTHPDYAVILCANRDEVLERPTAPAHWHTFEPVPPSPDSRERELAQPANGSVLSGRDLVAGGTWLGINKRGRIGFLTNITEPIARYPLSRGALLSTFLLNVGSLHSAVDALERKDGMFAGFNMLVFAPLQGSNPLRYDSRFITDGHRGGALSDRALTEDESIACGLSNGVDGKGGELYPKVLEGTRKLKEIAASLPSDASDDLFAERLLDLLASHAEIAPRDAEGRKSSICITPVPDSTPYGTRVSTVILVRRDGTALFVERERWVLGAAGVHDDGSQRRFRFKIEDPGA